MIKTIVIPRHDNDMVAFGAVEIEYTPTASPKVATIAGLLVALKHAITVLVNTDAEWKELWEESSEDFNVGDLEMAPLDKLNGILMRTLGVRILTVETFSMEGPTTWTFDDVLANKDEIK